MNMQTQAFHKAWLLVTTFVVISFGPIFMLGTMAATDAPARWTLDLLWWPFDGAQPYTEGAMRFLSALTGGFLTGWGALIFCLRRWVYDLAPEQTRRAVLAGLLSWFVIDSLGSVMSGAVPNVFFNVVVLLTAAGPLWRPAREA